MKKKRADEALYEALNLESMALARALIMEGRAFAGERKLCSVAETVRPDEILRVKGLLNPYVSRGAYKLKRALEVFDITLEDRVCVDIGSSTGGFTDIMLRNGAQRVYCVDVGYNLLDWRIRSDSRVMVMERTNARFLTSESFDQPPEFGATDVSFISLKLILPAVLPLLRAGAGFVALVKPQFEAAKEDVGEKGVVRSRDVHRGVLEDILSFMDSTQWKPVGLATSPIRGQEGNAEFLLYLKKKTAPQEAISEDAIQAQLDALEESGYYKNPLYL